MLKSAAPNVMPNEQPAIQQAQELVRQAQQPVQKSDDAPEKAIVAAGALQIASMAISMLSQGASQALMRGKEFTSAQNSMQIAGEMAKKNRLNIGVEFIENSVESVARVASKYGLNPQTLEPIARGQNAFYYDLGKLAVAPASKPSLMLHELGHACNAKNTLLKLLQNSRQAVRYAPVALLVLNGLAGKTGDGKENFVERNAGKLGFLAFLPTIIEEGIASIRGVKAAKLAQQALGKLDLGILKRNYFFAWSTYLLAGIGLGIATKLTFLERKNNNNNKQLRIFG